MGRVAYLPPENETKLHEKTRSSSQSPSLSLTIDSQKIGDRLEPLRLTRVRQYTGRQSLDYRTIDRFLSIAFGDRIGSFFADYFDTPQKIIEVYLEAESLRGSMNDASYKNR